MQYIIGGLIGFVLGAICLSVYDLFFKKDDLEEMTWVPFDEERFIV